jgi:proteasome component ECM29
MSTDASLEARELSLVSKVELRIALADTDEKLQRLLQTYLAPLLLKLASESHAVRSKVIAVCQHINTRIQPHSIQLPVTALLKQFKEQKSQLIRHFDLLYIQKGVDRLEPSARVELLPTVLQGVSELETASTQGASVFNLVLRLLPLLRLPKKDSAEDVGLREKLSLSTADTQFLSLWFGKLILLSPGGEDSRTCPGLSPSEYKFLNRDSSPEETWDPSKGDGLNLTETKVAVMRFLASGAFTNSDRFLPAVIASADSNSRLAEIGDDILKRFNPDMEDPQVVEQMYRLYFGTEGSDGAPPVRIPLQVKILSLLGRSVKATTYTDRIIRLLDQGLFSDAAKSTQGLQASKLRSQIFAFTTWVVRMGAPSDLELIAPKAITGLKEFVESQGWPDPGVSGQKLPHAALGLRGLAYESIGILAPKLGRRTHGEGDDSETDLDMDLLIWLFTSLGSDASSPEIFVSIEQALGNILNAFAGVSNEETQQRLCTFLLSRMRTRPGQEDPSTGFKIVRSTRFAAVRFANRCLPYGDSTARWIDLIAVGGGHDGAREIVEEGRKGLHPYWYRMLNPSKDGTGTVPPSTDVERNPRYEFPKFHDMTIVFGKLPELVHPRQPPPEYAEAFVPFVKFQRHLLLWEAFSRARIPVQIDEEWEHRLDTLLLSNEPARSALREYIQNSNHEVMCLFLGSALTGLLSKDGAVAADCGTDFVHVSSLTSNEVLTSLVDRAPSLLDRIYSTNDHATQNVAARAFGLLASHAALPESECHRLHNELVDRVASWKEAFGHAANRVRGALLAAAYLLSRLAYRRRLQIIPDIQVRRNISIVVDVLANSRDAQLREAAQLAIGQFSLSGILNPTIISEIGDWTTIKDKLAENAKKEQETAIHTLGQISLIMPKEGESTSMFDEILTTLYSLHEIRKPEVQFTVGESLSTAAAGWRSKSLIGEFDVDEKPLETNIPETILADMVDKLIEGCGASKPSLRKASAIWLLCLVKDCGNLGEVQLRLRRCQAAFTSLLADRDEVVQESGSRGLSLVYEMGDQALRDDLVRDLVRSFTGNSTNLAGRVSGDTELFEPGALPTGEGSSVTTYRDIMNLASEVGDPSLVYRFMSLASNNVIWSSRAAFGRFGLSNVLSDSSVNGYLARNPKLYPKLYRYRFDPNPNVQRSMNDIWRAMVKDPTAVTDAHFDDILEDLLSSIMTGREWRVRQASCAAIADLIQGRPLEKYDKYMSEILTKAFKVLDDIKESVRAAALRLCQVITNTLVRMLEMGDTDSKRAKAMLAHIVPFLLSQEGMDSSAQEVQAYAITTLIQIIKKSPGIMLRPFAPEILERFLTSLSSLEPQAVNYIHLNADKYGLTSQEIDKMRLSSIRMSPMMESIERYLLDGLDEVNVKEVADRLENVLRSAVGLPSKVGCSRVLVILSTKSLLFGPYADRFIQLLKKYVLDRNDTVSVSYTTAMGYLIRLASNNRVLDTIKFAKSLYFNTEETHHRAISGEILHSMSKLSSDRFAAFATATLPFVFVAKHDTDEHVREPFQKTWQDNVGGSRSVALYLKEILSLISEHLDSPRWAIKHTASLAAADVITCLDKTLDRSTGELVWPVLEKALAGKTWDGKATVLEAFVKFSASAKTTWQIREDIATQMRVRIAFAPCMTLSED